MSFFDQADNLKKYDSSSTHSTGEPEIFDILNKLNPEAIKDDIGNSTLSISHQKCCDGYIKCWRLSEPPHEIDISRHIFERLGKSL